MSNVKKNYAYQILYQILISILPFITSPYIARVMGADSIGIYSYSYTAATYFCLFAGLGIISYGNREIARTKNDQAALNKAFSSLYALHVAVTFVAILAYAVYLRFFVKDNVEIALVQSIYLIAQIIDINWFYFGLEKFKITAIRNCVIKCMTVVLIFLLVKQKSDLWKYALILSSGQFLSVLILWPMVPRYAHFCRISVHDVIVHIKPMVTLFFAVIAVSVYSYMDKIMIGWLGSYEQLGYYENAWRMIEFPVGFITALGTVMLPKISNLIVLKNERAVQEYFYKALRFSMLASSAIAFGICAISTEFSVVFWGADFSACGLIMRLLSPCIILMSWNSVIRTQYLIPRGFDKVYLYAVSGGAVVNLILNTLLIPSFGAAGASVATAISYATICTVQTFYVYKSLPVGKYFLESIPYLIIGLLMYLLVRFSVRYWTIGVAGLFLEVGVGVVSFAGLSLLYACISRDRFVTGSVQSVMNRVFGEKA